MYNVAFYTGARPSAVITGVALWGGACPRRCRRGVHALTRYPCWVCISGNTVYPQIWKQCDGGVLFAKTTSAAFRLSFTASAHFSQTPMMGISGIVIDG